MTSIKSALLAILASTLLLTTCRDRKVDDAELIRQLVREAAHAATQKDVPGVLEQVADEFKGELGFSAGFDEGGTINRQQLSFVLMRFMRKGELGVLLRSIDVEVTDASAHAAVIALVTNRNVSLAQLKELGPGRADAMRLDLQLARRDGGWWVTSARRQRIDAKTLLLGE